MKGLAVIILLACLTGCLACSVEDQVDKEPLKDLSEQMDVMAILQETIGQDLKNGDWEGAQTMASSLDSVLQVCKKDFDHHQRLKEPFREFYEKKISSAMKQLRKSLNERDKAVALDRYEYLVKRCNSCHNENEVAERAHL